MAALPDLDSAHYQALLASAGGMGHHAMGAHDEGHEHGGTAAEVGAEMTVGHADEHEHQTGHDH